MTKYRMVAIAGVLALAGTACSGSDDGGAIDAPTSGAVAVKGTIDNKFVPDAVTISVGDQVTWEWDGTHNVVAEDGSFRSGDIVNNGSFTHTFDTAGTFSYVCEAHETLGMVGSVTVEA